MMTNGEVFKEIFGIEAEDLFFMQVSDFVAWRDTESEYELVEDEKETE